MRGDLDRTHGLTACRIKFMQLVAGRESNVLTVEGDAVNAVGTRKGSIFAKDFGG